MNKAITDGVVLMPTPFSAGLDVWSSGDGTPGSDTYDNIATATFVAADQDFAGCLELLKTDATQQLRYMGQVPITPGCYLRVTARVKALSGSLPDVRIAAWAGDAGGAAVIGIPLFADSVSIATYGPVVEVSAIIGSGNRSGVDMVWGRAPTYGHFGLDFTGASGGLLRVDDIEIEDVTGVFLRDMLGYVDVRDYGAVGDGVTDDSAAFEAADAVTDGATLFVSSGTYLLAEDVTLDSEVIFEGTVTMPTDKRLSLTKNFSLPTYIDAFGDEEEALRKALQALMNDADHESLYMGGRRITLSGPLDV